MASFRRVTVKAGVNPQQAVRLGLDLDWTLLDIRSEGEAFVDHVFETDDGTRIHVMEDHSISKCFFSIRGPSKEQVVRQILAMNDKKLYPLKVNTREEALELASKLEDPADIYFAALSSDDDFDEGIFGCYRHAFEHPDSDARFYACTSIGYFVGWEEHFTPLLTNLAQKDRDPDIREIAAKTLQVAAKHDWNRIPSPATT